MKLSKNKNVIAILTVSLLTVPTVVKANNKLDAYYEDSNMNIEKYNSFSLKISKSKLEELLHSSKEEIVRINIEDEEVIINREELINLKEKAEKYERENKEYTIIITIISSLVITSIILKEKMKEKTYIK